VAEHAAAAAGQLSESIAAGAPLAQVISLRAATPARALKTAEVVARTLRRLIVEGQQHTAEALRRRRKISRSHYDVLMNSYRCLVDLLRADDGAAAEAHWRRHMDTARELLLRGLATVKVRDVVD